jgi:hypothetical protein
MSVGKSWGIRARLVPGVVGQLAMSRGESDGSGTLAVRVVHPPVRRALSSRMGVVWSALRRQQRE